MAEETLILYNREDPDDFVEIPFSLLEQYESRAEEPSLMSVILEDIPLEEGEIAIPLALINVKEIRNYLEKGSWSQEDRIVMHGTQKQTREGQLKEVSFYLNFPYRLRLSLVPRPRKVVTPVYPSSEEEEYLSEDSETDQFRRELEEARLDDYSFSSSEEDLPDDSFED